MDILVYFWPPKLQKMTGISIVKLIILHVNFTPKILGGGGKITIDYRPKTTILRTFFVDKIRQREFTSAHRPFFDEKMVFFCVFLPKTTTIISVFYFFFKNAQVYRPNLWKKIVFCCKITLIIWLLALLFFSNTL